MKVYPVEGLQEYYHCIQNGSQKVTKKPIMINECFTSQGKNTR